MRDQICQSSQLLKRTLKATFISGVIASGVLTSKAAQADCPGGSRCTTYDFSLPVTITNTSSSPSLTVMGGNVGVGTTTPAYALDIAGGYARISNAYSTGLYLNNTTTGATYGIYNASAAANGFSGLGFFDGSEYRMTIVGTNVGIDTTTPGAPLEVNAANISARPSANTMALNSNFTATNGTGGFESLLMSNGGTNPGTSILGPSISFKAATYGSTSSLSTGRILSYFDTSGGTDPGYTGAVTAFQSPTADNTFSTAMVVRNGHVGIGTTTPTYPLDVSGGYVRVSNAFSTGVYLNNTTTGLTYGIFNASTAANGFSGLAFFDGTDYRMSIVGNNVGIGNTSPAYPLDVTGTMHVSGQAYTDSGNGSFSITSDARLKDIRGSYERGLDELLKIDTIRFNYKLGNPMNSDSTQEYIGVTAQNLKTAIPEAVHMEKNGYLSVNTSPVIWTLVNGVKDLNQREKNDVAQLKSENAELKAEVTALKVYLCSKDPSAPICM